MRKYLVLALIPMFFGAMACQKSEEPAPESSAPAASAEASPAPGEAAPPSGGAIEASPAPFRLLPCRLFKASFLFLECFAVAAPVCALGARLIQCRCLRAGCVGGARSGASSVIRLSCLQ
jgi:hypothetical protein